MSPPATPAKTQRANARAQRSSPSRSAPAHPAPASAASNAPADQGAKTLEFLVALGARDPVKALAAWNSLGKHVKTNIENLSLFLSLMSGSSGDVIEDMLDVMGKDALAPMHEAGVDIGSERAYVKHVLGTHDGAYWLQPLKAAQQWRSFVDSEPRGTDVTDDQADKLNSFVQAATVAADARDLFEKVYPNLDDNTYNPVILDAIPWNLGAIQRLYRALTAYLPVEHVHTIVQGFHLGVRENLNRGGFRQLGFGWWHGDHVVLPASSATRGEGGRGHDMTGGGTSGVAVAGTPNDPALTHWEGTVLHEIGHGVGAKTDGNAFAERHGGWQRVGNADAWSRFLFDDVAAAAAVAANRPPPPVLAASDARLYMAHKIAGRQHPVGGWREDQIRRFIDQHYSGQPLYTYYESCVVQRQGDYRVSDDNISGGRVYIWCSRFGNQYASYQRLIYDNKVSWYGLSSPKEWFAEVYTYYYRTGKAAPLLDPATKQKLDDIDGKHWDPAAARGQGALVPGTGGGGRPDAAAAQTSPAAQTAQAGAAPLRRLPFPW